MWLVRIAFCVFVGWIFLAWGWLDATNPRSLNPTTDLRLGILLFLLALFTPLVLWIGEKTKKINTPEAEEEA